MFPIRPQWLPPCAIVSARPGRLARVAAISLGLGVTTAVAAELTITPEPSPRPISDADYAASGWSYFDPGFLVDHLPFKLTVGQTISYSDNVSNLPSVSPLAVGVNSSRFLPSRGDFFSDTTIAAASRFYLGGQALFLNATYAPRRYFKDTVLNADNYSINGGTDFRLGARCSGTLVAGVDNSQTSLAQTVGFGVQDVQAVSFNETARCKLTGSIDGLFNSGVSRVENSGSQFGSIGNLSSALNNYNQQYVGAGLEYAMSQVDSLRGFVTLTHRSFPDRPAIGGLASDTDQQDFQVSYSRVFSAKLDASASLGVSVFQFAGAAGMTTEPSYSVQVNYRPTPKVTASASVARSSGAPQSAISNLQISDTQSLSLSYKCSPKLDISGVLSHTKSQNPGASNLLENSLASAILFADSSSDNASVVVNYRASPLLTATAAYSYISRTDTSRSGFNAVSNLFRVGLIYTR